MINVTAKKQYGERTVLDVTDLTFEEGKAYALIGANGSGKSTLLKIMDGQLKAAGGNNIGKSAVVGYMPQNSYAFSMSVRRNILLPAKLIERNQRIGRMYYLTDALDLNGLLRKNAVKLSGGETQRMALARTLMTNSDILLLDEPTSAMDVEQAKAVVSLLKKENESHGTTLIFATHSLKQAEALADEVIFLSAGVVTERGKPADILHNPKSAELAEFVSFNT